MSDTLTDSHLKSLHSMLISKGAHIKADVLLKGVLDKWHTQRCEIASGRVANDQQASRIEEHRAEIDRLRDKSDVLEAEWKSISETAKQQVSRIEELEATLRSNQYQSFPDMEDKRRYCFCCGQIKEQCCYDDCEWARLLNA